MTMWTETRTLLPLGPFSVSADQHTFSAPLSLFTLGARHRLSAPALVLHTRNIS